MCFLPLKVPVAVDLIFMNNSEPQFQIKGLVHPKIVIILITTHPCVIPNLCASLEHKLRYFRLNPRALSSSVDSNSPDSFKIQKKYQKLQNRLQYML